MTEKGKQAYFQSLKRESLHNIMSCLSEAEREQLMPCLLRIRDKGLKEAGIEKKPLFP